MSAKMQTQTSKPSTRRRLGGCALAVATGVLALAGCGSSSSSSTSSTASQPAATTPAPAPATTATTTSTPQESATSEQKLTLAAGSGLSYDKKSLSAKAGAVSIAFTNSSALEHDVSVESSSGEQLGATEKFVGGTKTLKLTLKAGTYKFFCSVPGHRQGGMEGTLTVQ